MLVPLDAGPNADGVVQTAVSLVAAGVLALLAIAAALLAADGIAWLFVIASGILLVTAVVSVGNLSSGG